jgi:hypothetical protein
MGGQGKYGLKDPWTGGEMGRLGILVDQMMSILTSTFSTFFVSLAGGGTGEGEREGRGEGVGEGAVGGEHQG